MSDQADSMTLRDQFAAKALSGLLVNGDPGGAATLAYKFADDMLKTRGTPFPPEEDALLFAAAHDLLDSSGGNGVPRVLSMSSANL